MLLDRLSIQSKLVLMLLTVSVGSIVVIAYLGFSNGESMMAAAIENQLTGMRETKSNELDSYLGVLRNEALTLATGDSAIDAVRGFTDAFRKLDLKEKELPKEQLDALTKWYRDDFIPKLDANVETSPVAENYLPRTVAARYLQYYYIASAPGDYLSKAGRDSAEDGSDYTALHKRYHPRFREVLDKYKFADLILVDADSGDVVYSVEKSTAFGTNLRVGQYKDSALADLVDSVRKGKDRGDYQFSDFDFYRPNLARPTAFVATPIFDGVKMTGVLVLQFPHEQIDRVMTGGGDWVDEGLGQTGEVYLVGPDGLLRSRIRGFAPRGGDKGKTDAEKLQAAADLGRGTPGGKTDEERKQTAAELAREKFRSRSEEEKKRVTDELIRAGVSPRTLDRVRSLWTLTKILPVGTPQVKLALDGKTGIISSKNYREAPVLSAYAPFEFQGERWAVLAEMEESESFAPIRKFGRVVLSYSAAIILVVTILATLMATLLVRPIGQLVAGAKGVAEGKLDTVVTIHGRDEFRELADAFNEMTTSLRSKTEQIEQKARENEQLLLNILPIPFAARLKGGDAQASEGFADVTMLFADITGFTALSDTSQPDEAAEMLNQLVGAMDEAAERHGVEKVRTVGSSYMAACGLSVQRPDHTNRMVEFAMDVLRIVRRFNQEHGTTLAAEIGINAGPVVGGIVGRSKFLFDLWGETVNIARGIKNNSAPDSVTVTAVVKDRLRDAYKFQPSGDVDLPGRGTLSAWSLEV